ncbi:MAG: phosphoadenosine phosphosulfate reductase family protein [Bacteroidota bacterium]
MRTLSWFSCGAASAIATKIAFNEVDNVEAVYCDPGSEHPDNERFMMDCEEWFGVNIIRLKSDEYNNVDEVIEAKKYLSGIAGAPCTGELKRLPRHKYQRHDDLHVFGYTSEETRRANSFKNNNPELNLWFPLIEKGINKNDCLAILGDKGIELPAMYKLGYEHNNCLGCVKSGGVVYWDKIRRHFPEVFKMRCQQSRKYGAKLLIIWNPEKGENERFFLDELPQEIDAKDDVGEHVCDFLCQSISNEL